MTCQATLGRLAFWLCHALNYNPCLPDISAVSSRATSLAIFQKQLEDSREAAALAVSALLQSSWLLHLGSASDRVVAPGAVRPSIRRACCHAPDWMCTGHCH